MAVWNRFAVDDVVETALTEISAELLGLEVAVRDVRGVYVYPEEGLDREIAEGGDGLPLATSYQVAGEEVVVPSCPLVVVVDALHQISLEEAPLAKGVVRKWVVLQDPSPVFVLHLYEGHLRTSCVDHGHLVEAPYPVSYTHTDFLAALAVEY